MSDDIDTGSSLIISKAPVPSAGAPASFKDPYEGTVAGRSYENLSQMPDWMMANDLLGGTRAMRAAGAMYLPKHEAETQANWNRRLSVAVLFNAFRIAVCNAAGKPFAKDIVVPEGYPEPLVSLIDDVDGKGSTATTFFHDAFKKGIAKGMVHCLVDFPQAQDGDTAVEEQRRMPYFVMIEAEDLLSATYEIRGGEEVLTEVRILESRKEQDGEWATKTTRRVRVITEHTWAIYEEKPRGVGAKSEWILSDEQGVNSLGVVSLVTFYADREGFMVSRPPMLDLMFKNVEHWQSASDQRNILTITRFPILAGSGVNPADKVDIGPQQFMAVRDAQGRIYYVEHSGAAVASGREDLTTLKEEMGVLGLALFMPQASGDITATAKAIDGAQASTGIEGLAIQFMGFINACMWYAAYWLELVQDGEVLTPLEYFADWEKQLLDISDMNFLLTARAAKDISRETLLQAFKRRGVLPPSFDAEADAQAISEEKPQGMPEAQPAAALDGSAQQSRPRFFNR